MKKQKNRSLLWLVTALCIVSTQQAYSNVDVVEQNKNSILQQPVQTSDQVVHTAKVSFVDVVVSQKPAQRSFR